MNKAQKTWLCHILTKNADKITKLNLCWAPDGKGNSGGRK